MPRRVIAVLVALVCLPSVALATSVPAAVPPVASSGAAPAATSPGAAPAVVAPPGSATVLGGREPVSSITAAKMAGLIDDKQAATAFVTGSLVAVAKVSGASYVASLPATSGEPGALTTANVADRLRAGGAMIVAPPSASIVASSGSSSSRAFVIMFAALAVMMLGAVVINLWQRKHGKNGSGIGGGGSSGHGKLRDSAKLVKFPTRFADVAGCDEAVEELQEVVLFLKEPERFAEVGARMPRGVILHGPPGTGKTLLAKAVAGEANVPFYSVSGSDFVEMFVGVGASRVRDLFAKASKHKEGAVIFFDEIDAIGRKRGGSGTPGNDSERDQTLNQLLVSMDGFDQRQRIVVIAATNRLDMLDDALLRPGRFDRRVRVDLPAEKGRYEILQIHATGKPLESPVRDLKRLAHASAGTSGADLQNILNEAAIMAARKGAREITWEDLIEGQLRALAGPQRKDPVIGPDELRRIAWHEAGHCLTAELCATHEKAQRITILARGQAAGLALYGSSDHAMHSPQHLHERMVVAMGGRAAEQIGFGDISSGAANDLEQVNRMARHAIAALGFSPTLGQLVAMGGGQQFPLAPETLRTIDLEVARMAQAAYEDALQMLAAHRDELERLAEALYAEEQIDRAGIEAVLRGTAAIDAPTPPRQVLALPAE